MNEILDTLRRASSDANYVFIYDIPGIYTVKLTVTDSHAASSTDSVDVWVGNINILL